MNVPMWGVGKTKTCFSKTDGNKSENARELTVNQIMFCRMSQWRQQPWGCRSDRIQGSISKCFELHMLSMWNLTKKINRDICRPHQSINASSHKICTPILLNWISLNYSRIFFCSGDPKNFYLQSVTTTYKNISLIISTEKYHRGQKSAWYNQWKWIGF